MTEVPDKERRKENHARANEIYASMHQYGEATLKGAVLINGGACVALLALLGNLFSKG